MAMDSRISKSWNNEDKLLHKFIGSNLDSEIKMGMKTQSGHKGLKLSIEAW